MEVKTKTKQQQRRAILDKVAIVATLKLKEYREKHHESLRGSLYKTATVIKSNFLTACRNGKNNGYSYETSTALIAAQRKQSRKAITAQINKLLEIGFLTDKQTKGSGQFPNNYFLWINPEALGNVFQAPDAIKGADNPACFDDESRRIRHEVNQAAFTAATLLARYADERNAKIPYEDRAERLRGSLADTAQTILSMLFTVAKNGENNGYSFKTTTSEIAKEKGQSRQTILRHLNKLAAMEVLEYAELKGTRQYFITFNQEIIRDVLSDVDFTKKIAEESQKEAQEASTTEQGRNGTIELKKPLRPANDGFDDTQEGWRTYLSDLLFSLENPAKFSEKPPDSS